ncbi:hypothetical protein F0562_022958 [Nyssa sinensis]|uniref:PdxS/SNZ N-terminal domain-containing protein n=1 Tax=Nyssa sinensis TaxID=561372 RepID=A0A5J5BGK9_9ASTE|nr:hypothetical protein F0562_022958 [Nyssa sinensis]
MADDGAVTVYNSSAITDAKKNSFSIKVGLAQMLRGGAILEVTNAGQAKIAESAGACCVIVSEPFQGGISRMPDPSLIKEIKRAVSIPVMVKARVGHFVEAQILEAVGVDYIDESELLAVADEDNYINKHNFRAPFVCGCRDLGEALRRIAAHYDIVAQTKQMGRLPVVHFAAGGIVTPADAAFMMQLGCDGVFVGSEIFNCSDPYKQVRAIVQAVRNYNDPHVLAETSCGLHDAMSGLDLGEDRVEEFGTGGTY